MCAMKKGRVEFFSSEYNQGFIRGLDGHAYTFCRSDLACQESPAAVWCETAMIEAGDFVQFDPAQAYTWNQVHRNAQNVSLIMRGFNVPVSKELVDHTSLVELWIFLTTFLADEVLSSTKTDGFLGNAVEAEKLMVRALKQLQIPVSI